MAEKVELILQAKDLASQAVKAMTQAMDQIPQKERQVNAELVKLKTEANQFVAKLTNDRIKLAEIEKKEKLRQLYEYYKQGLISTQQYHDSFKAINKKMQESAAEPSFFNKLKSNWLAVTGAIIAAWALVSKAIDYMKLGAAAQQAETSFKQVTTAYGENADKLLAKMKEVSKGTIDESNLMQRAVKGLQQGLSGDQIVKVLEIARTAARVAGSDIKSAFDGMTDAIANQQLKALKQYGIVIDLNNAFEKYAEKIGLSKDMLTEYDQTQAIYNAVVEEGTRQAEAFGKIQMDATEKIQRAKAAAEDLKEEIGKGLQKAIEIATAGFYKLLSALSYVSGGYYKVIAAIERLLGNSKEAAVANKMAALSFEEANRQAEKASDLWDKAIGKLDEAAAKELENARNIAKVRQEAANEAAHVAAIEKKANEEKAKSYIETGKKISDAIKSSEDRIKSLAKANEDIAKETAQTLKSIDKDISDIQSKGKDINPFELWQKAQQKFSEASSTSLQGNLNDARQYLLEAQEIGRQLGMIPGQEADAEKILLEVKRRVMEVDDERILKNQQTINQEITNIKQLTMKAEELKTKLENLQIKVDSSELDSVIEKYKNLDGSEIRVRVIQEQVSGPAATMARGGFFPGYGGGDRIPVLAEAGEFFHRKEAVRYYGTALMQHLNRMALPRGFMDYLFRNKTPSVSNLPLKMREGGEVPVLGHYTLDLKFGTEKVTLQGDEFNVRTLVKMLERAKLRGG